MQQQHLDIVTFYLLEDNNVQENCYLVALMELKSLHHQSIKDYFMRISQITLCLGGFYKQYRCEEGSQLPGRTERDTDVKCTESS